MQSDLQNEGGNNHLLLLSEIRLYAIINCFQRVVANN